MGSKVGNIVKAVLPIAASLAAPGIGTALGYGALGTAGIGAGLAGAGSLATGGGIKGALSSALAGGLGAGGADYLSGSGGLGLTGAGANAVSKGLTGAAVGYNGTGDFTGALTGGALGGLGGYLSGGGLDTIKEGLGIGAEGADAAGYGTSADGVTSSAFKNGVGSQGGISGVGSATSAAPLGGGASSFGSAAGSTAAGGSSFGGASLSSLLSGGVNAYAQDQATDQLVRSQQDSLDQLKPFMQNGINASNALGDYLGTSGNTGSANYGAGTAAFTPDDLQNDPGYQFNLTQGQNALNNSLSAAGGLQSGAAIKAGQQFAQDLAGTTFGNAFSRDLASKQLTTQQLSGATTPGLQAGFGVADVNNNIGTAQSKGTQSLANTFTGTLSSLLSGNGAKQIIGYNPNGTPIYA